MNKLMRRAHLLLGLGAGIILGVVNISGSKSAALLAGVVCLVLGFALLEYAYRILEE